MPSPIRILTAVPICDGHDSAINTINLEFIRHGIEVIYLGFHRYVGDIGDYLKFGLLRALSPGHRLGVASWLYPDENHNRDGRHIG